MNLDLPDSDVGMEEPLPESEGEELDNVLQQEERTLRPDPLGGKISDMFNHYLLTEVRFEGGGNRLKRHRDAYRELT